MNKTLSVNIGGIVFHIEELAYDRLTKYLDAIKGYFTSSDGRDEIMQDIEARLGEMFQERISGGKQVIVDSDVEYVINIMGKPEQVADATDDGDSPRPSASERRGFRRLYRDPDDRIVGGVCSGFAHYLNLDPIWIRLAFAISFFVFGTGFLLYIILMFIMPKALTTAEKLEMKGEQVNLSNIRRSVEDEIGSIKNNYNSSGASNRVSGFFDAVGQLLVGFIKLIGKIIAGFLIIIGLLILIGFIMALFALIGIGSVTVPFFITDMVLLPWQQSFALIGGFLMIGIPIIMIIYTAVRVLFNIKAPNRIVNWSAFALWIVGLGMSISVASSIAGEFKMSATSKTQLSIVQPSGDTLSLNVLNPVEKRYDWYLDNGNHFQMPWATTDNYDSLRIDNVRLDIVKSTGAEFELSQLISSRGSDRKEAYDNAKSIVYNYNQTENEIKLDEAFVISKGNKYRGQKIQLVLKVPVGKSIFLSPEMEDIIYDIENVTDTYDGYMVDHTWTMTENGLECIGCDLPEGRKSRRKDNNLHIRIDDHGVNVNGEENDTIINVNDENVDIKINGNGVHIKTHDKK